MPAVRGLGGGPGTQPFFRPLARYKDPFPYRDPWGTLVAFPEGVERSSGNADSVAELGNGEGELALVDHVRGPKYWMLGQCSIVLQHMTPRSDN